MSNPGDDLFVKRFFLGAGWVLARLGGRQVLTTISYLYFATQLGPKEFGIGSLAISISFIGKLLLERGVMDAVVKENYTTDRWLSTAFWLAIIVAAFIMIAVIMGAAGLSLYRGGMEGALVFLVTPLLILAFGCSRVHEGLLRREFRFKRLAIIQIIAVLLAFSVGFSVLSLGGGCWSMVAFALTECIVISAFVIASATWRVSFEFDLDAAKKILNFSGPVAFSSVLTGGNLRFIEVMVGAVLGPTSAGIYRVAAQINMVMNQALRAPVTQMVLPSFTRITERREFTARSLDTIAASSFVCFPSFLFLALVVEDFIIFVLGDVWADAGLVASWLLLSVVGLLITPITAMLLIARDEVAVAFRQSLIIVLMTCGGAFIGLQTGVLSGGAMGFSIGSILALPYVLAKAINLLDCKIGDLAVSTMPYLVAAVLACGVLELSRNYMGEFEAPLLLNSFGVVAASIFYLTLVWVSLVLFDKDRLHSISNLVKRFKIV
ncbi:oligosaccharide flippase family protein [Algiphilus sp.]|uniref:oligosaccharide flippase family protein n=1 Tax=Algiphilus sp. TaxID=1872431 RepID=UPI003BAC0818